MTPVQRNTFALMDRSIILVGLGGFIGSVARYLVAVLLAGYTASVFPFATLIVNLVGCFLIGLLFALSDRGNLLSTEWRIFLTTGFCGGFTTFSTFSYESLRLIQDGEYLYFGAYVLASVLIGLAATFLGIILVRAI
jgi:CrcB protein